MNYETEDLFESVLSKREASEQAVVGRSLEITGVYIFEKVFCHIFFDFFAFSKCLPLKK